MFDTALVESGPSRRVRSEGAGLPMAIAAHLLVIGAFLGASAWRVGDPAEPETRIAAFPTFVSLPAPPPPGGGNPSPAPPRLRNDLRIQESAVTDRPAPEQGPISPGPVEPGADGIPGDGPGTGPGVPGGTGSMPGALPGEPGEPEPILRPGQDVTEPILVTRVEPNYPETARRLHLEGILILEAVITAAGDVQDVHVLRSVHPLLDAAAAQAVRQWRYRPATRNGRAVPVYLTVTVTFSLKD